MATKFLEPGGDADFGTFLWSSILNAPSVATDFVHGAHLRSLKYRPNVLDQVVQTGVVSDSGGRISLYVYLVALPSGTVSAPVLCNNSGNNSVLTINITSAGVLQIVNNAGTQLGTNGATLATGTWYRLCLAWTVTSSTVNQVRLFLDGVQTISLSNVTLDATTMTKMVVGNNVPDLLFDFRSSDHYVDDSTSLADTGDIWVTAKRPFSNGTTNGFSTQVGAGNSGYGTGHSTQVNERPLSSTNGWSIQNAAVNTTEEYNIEDKRTGDFNIANGRIIDYMGWVSVQSSLAADNAKIILNNVTTNIAVASGGTSLLFTAMAGSTVYPTGTGTDIGLISDTGVTTTLSLLECGIVVAFIPIAFTGSLLRMFF